MKNSKKQTEQDISVALSEINKKIADTEKRFDRGSGSVRLLAVSKTRSINTIQAAVKVGQFCFAENYLQEATAKIMQLRDPRIEWHFIGSIQSNKIRGIVQHFQWVHAVDRMKVLHRLNELRAGYPQPLNVCLQINISKEESKAGMKADELQQFAENCALLPNIKLRGLMAMPASVADFVRQRHAFRELRRLFIELQANYPELDTLSMGTSHDFEAAIAEGSTMVRVGKAIFGARD